MLSGGEIALLHLVTHLDRSRFEPVVLLSSHGPLEGKMRDAGIETHVLPLAPSVVEARKDHLDRHALTRVRDLARLLKYSAAVAGLLRKRKVDLLHTNSLKADIIGGLAGRLARVPVLWHIRDRIEEDYLPPKVVRVFRRLCRILPSFVIANSAATLHSLRLPQGEREHGRVVHDGIPIPPITAHSNGKEYSQAAPRIGIVGRISQWKGQHIFLQAAAVVQQEFPQARFQIIGSALFGEEKYERSIREEARTLGLNGNVEWLGFRTDVPELIKALDVLVHASVVGEPFGQVVVEAMVESKPVIATRGGGIPEIIVDGVSGLLVPMNDAPAMSDAILKLLRNPEQAECLGNAGRVRVEEYFSIERTARAVERAYAKVLCLSEPA
jgi:glycosyltransferase involved in cell wall biosynthesis